MFEVRAFMTVPELAKLANIDRKRMARFLESAGVPMHPIGAYRRVFLSDIKAKVPSLWESLCELRRMGL